MAEYLIHTCPSRLWYVKEYLIPNLEASGIPLEAIQIHEDKDGKGILESFLKSADKCKDESKGKWHLQDDILISSDFKSRTEELDDGLVCGIATEFDRDRKGYKGEVSLHQMWYSFPCIRIPNSLMQEFKNWYDTYMRNNPIYRHVISSGKNDDMLFRMFLEANYENKPIKIINAAPNLVEHVDFLIGGSVANNNRVTKIQALYFEEPNLVEELKDALDKRRLI